MLLHEDCFCLGWILISPSETYSSPVVCHSQDKASIFPAPFLLTEDCSKLYISFFNAIMMWFKGLEQSFIYDRHIALQEREIIFKWVKRVHLSLCSSRVTTNIRCLLRDCVEQQWGILFFLFWRGHWWGDLIVIFINEWKKDWGKQTQKKAKPAFRIVKGPDFTVRSAGESLKVLKKYVERSIITYTEIEIHHR